MQRFILTFLLTLNSILIVFSQEPEHPGIFAKKAVKPVLIDGILNEEIWQDIGWESNFIQTFPTDTAKAIAETKV